MPLVASAVPARNAISTRGMRSFQRIVDLGVVVDVAPQRAEGDVLHAPERRPGHRQHGQARENAELPAEAYFIFSRAFARHLASSLSCSGVMRGTIIGNPALG